MKKENIKNKWIILRKILFITFLILLWFAVFIANMLTPNSESKLIPIILMVGLIIITAISGMLGANLRKDFFRKTIDSNKINNVGISENVKNKLLKILEENDEQLKGYRRKIKNKCIVGIVIILIFFIIVFMNIDKIIVFLQNVHDQAKDLISTFIFVIFFFYAYEIVKLKRNFVEIYKENVICKMLNILNYNLKYNADGTETLCEKYVEAQFKDLHEVGSFKVSDYIYGNVSETIQTECCQMQLVDKKKNKFDEFLFAYAKLENSISSPIRIRNKEFLTDEKVIMDNQNFEEYFDVISEENILTMQILTHDTMEQILLVYQKYGIPFEMIIKNDGLFIKFYTGKIFEPKIFDNEKEFDNLCKYYCIINAIVGLSIKTEEIINKKKI